MAATVDIYESNNSGGEVVTVTNNVNMGSADHVDLDTTNHKITPGNCSYQKYHRIGCSAAGGSTSISNFKVWASSGLSANCTLYFNGHTTQGTYDSTKKTSFGTAPSDSQDSTYAINSMASITSEPASANLGYGGTLDSPMDITSGLTKYSDYLVTQIRTTSSATGGTTVIMYYQYDEVA